MSDIVASIDLPGGDRLALHGLSGADRGAVARLDPAGRMRWIARPPEAQAQDAYVSLALESGAAVVDSFQGLRVHLDLDSGEVLDRTFVK